MPTAAHRGGAGDRRSRNVIPQAKFARGADKEIPDRRICRSSVTEKINLTRITHQVKVDTPVPLTVGGRKSLLSVGIAVGGIALCRICATVNQGTLNGQPCARSPCR